MLKMGRFELEDLLAASASKYLFVAEVYRLLLSTAQRRQAACGGLSNPGWLAENRKSGLHSDGRLADCKGVGGV